MKNLSNMRFKVGSYFIWSGDMFRVIDIKYETYMVEPYDYTNFIPGSTFEFFRYEEYEMIYVSKKKNPELFL